MEKEKIHISCMGTCIVRDIVGMFDDNAGYVVEKFVQSLNPISIVEKSPLKREFEPKDIFFDKPNFYQRCEKLDLDKCVFEYMGGAKSDYILIDFGCMRYPIFKTQEGCGTVVFPEKIPLLLEKGYISKYSIKPTLDYKTEEIYVYLDYYFKRLLQIYTEEQIIIVDVRCCLYTSNDRIKRLAIFNAAEIEKDNVAINMAYQYALQRLPKAHVIPFSEHMLCDVNHKWGNAKLHYIIQYYEYALAALNIITCEKYDKNTEKLIISSLCDDIDKYCMYKKEEYTYFSIKYKCELDDLCKRYKAYEQYFKIVVIKNKTDMIKEFFQRCKSDTIGLYGFNEISKFYIDILYKWNIYKDEQIQKILIIETGNIEYKGMETCARDAKRILETDNIVICDMLNIQRIKDKLKHMCYQGKVIDPYEMINEKY